MVTTELQDYIKDALKQGTAPKVIKEDLKKVGWSEGDIDSVLGTKPKSSRHLTPVIFEWTFRIGFAAVFLINSAVAVIDPRSFISLLQDSFILKIFPHMSFWIIVIAVNDGLLGLLILGLGWKYKIIDAWAGVWLLIVTYLKFISLLK